MPRSLLAIIVVSLLVAVLDALAAVIVYQVNPVRMFQFIASGVFGKESFSGGSPMALYGLFFHLFIAFFWTTLYFVLYPKVQWLSRNKIVSGLGYGIIIWLGMNMLVLPISHGSPREITTGSIIGIVILMVAVGLPISWMAHRHFTKK